MNPPSITTPALPTVTVSSLPLDIPPGAEVFKCRNLKNPFGKDVAIVQSESTMTEGSHHMFVFHDPAYVSDSPTLEDCSGVELHDFVHLAQSPHVTWTYPDGVARLLRGTDGLRFAVHYVNTTTDTLTAQVSVTFSYTDPSSSKFLAAPIFLNQTLLVVPEGTSTASRQFAVPYDIELMRAVGHMHSRGIDFTATASTGEMLYEGTDWNEPQERVFDPPLELVAGTTITWSCKYQNDTGLVLTFGESATQNEMCILYGLFYPTDPSANQGVTIGGLI